MPNRILREGILTSPRIAKLSWPAEVFYRRLHSVVDDYGRYHAHPMLLRAACYPLQLDKVSDSDIGKWMRETAEAALVRVYPAEDGKDYLELLDFRQQVRAAKSKFPPPTADATQMRSRCLADAEPLHTKTETESETKKTLSGKPDPVPVSAKKSGDSVRILEHLNRVSGKAFKPVAANLELIEARLREASVEDVLAVIDRQAAKWGSDEKMSEYLRPATLFNRKNFAQYDAGKLPQIQVDL